MNAAEGSEEGAAIFSFDIYTAGKDAQEFLDNLEIACLVTGRDDDATRLRVFPLLIKAEAKACFNTLLPANRGDWAGLRVLFLAKVGGGGETSESLWGKVCKLRQGSLFEYNVYELQFVELWERWVASLRLREAAPDFLKKDRFVAGLCPPLREKMKGMFPVTWMDARDIARLKERKIRYQLQQREVDQEEEGMAPVPPTNAPTAHRGQGNQDQQELLSRITHQLKDLSVRGGREPPPNQEQARGPRRQAQEYHCYNCGENGHGMYYCPHPRRTGNFRGPRNQVSPPRERQQQPPPFSIQQAPPVQILRPPVQPQQQQPSPPPPPPPPIAPIPPLPIPENRAVNVISLDAKVKVEEEERGKSLPKDKGKAKVEDVDTMPIKRARQEEAAMSETGERRKSKENGESSSKKKSKPRRKITIKDFALSDCIRLETSWNDPVDSMSVHAYITHCQNHEAIVEEKRRHENSDEGPSKRSTRSGGRNDATPHRAPPTEEAPSPEVTMEESTTGKKKEPAKGKQKSTAYKLQSDIELATDLKKVLEERIVDDPQIFECTYSCLVVAILKSL
ncbi:hypothetical protein L7F22_047892 [Adiantum nelumboides]|nr:hypothetical protein [Adiantum nelumboides]